MADYRPAWMAWVSTTGSVVVVEPDGKGGTVAQTRALEVAVPARTDQPIVVTVPSKTGAVQTIVYTPTTQSVYNGVLARWQGDLMAQYQSGPCTVGVRGHDAEFAFTGAAAHDWCARLERSAGYEYVRASGETTTKALVCTIDLPGATARARDTGARAIAGEVCGQLRRMAFAPDRPWDAVQGEAAAEGRSLTALAATLRDRMGDTQDATRRLTSALDRGRQRVGSVQDAVKLLRERLTTEKERAAARPISCATAEGSVQAYYEGSMVAAAGGVLAPRRSLFADATTDAERALADGDRASVAAGETARSLDAALKAGRYPPPDLRARPGDEQPVLAAYQTAAQAARRDLPALKGQDAQAGSDAKALLQEGKIVADGARAAAGCK